MADSYLWYEHTDAAVANALSAAGNYVQTNPPTFKAFQVTQNSVLNIAPQGATYQVPANHWIVRSEGGEISVYSNTDFTALYESVT